MQGSSKFNIVVRSHLFFQHHKIFALAVITMLLRGIYFSVRSLNQVNRSFSMSDISPSQICISLIIIVGERGSLKRKGLFENFPFIFTDLP